MVSGWALARVPFLKLLKQKGKTVIIPAPNYAECAFSSCNHAKAVVTFVHEHVNHPQKHLCAVHAAKVKDLLK